jgi:predicted phage terminase large subunit-like protein
MHGLEKLYESDDPRLSEEVVKFVRAGGAKQVDEVDKKAEKRKVDLQKELAERALAQRHLIPFVKRFMPTYKVGWVHHDICRRLEQFVRDIEAGKSPRLILAMPPRAGKSLLASDMFPSWVLGKHPDWDIISTSYAVSLPIKFSRNIIDRLHDPSYHQVFEARLREDSQGVEQWRLTAGGGYRAAGVGGGITGMGANILIIDDPFSDDEEAQSDNIREKVKNWFTSTAMTRLAPSNGVLIIATRWHDDDLSGHCLATMKELLEAEVPEDEIDMWELISYPALAEADEYLFPDGTIRRGETRIPEGARLLRKEGEALHPARYDEKALRRKKNTMPPRQWNAMFQQNPVPDDGEFFSRDMFRHEAGLMGKLDEYTFITAWDVAIGEKLRNDWTVGIVLALDAKNNIHVVDMIRGRLDTMGIVTSVCDLIQKWDCAVFGMEHGAIKMTVWPLILEEMRRRKISCSINDDLKPILDKETRATPLRALMQTGRVYYPMQSQAPWVERVIGEMLRFPSGTHDDIVDALAWGARMFRTAPKPNIPVYENVRIERSFRDRLDEFGVDVYGFASDTTFMSS